MCGTAGLIGVAPELARPAASAMLRALRHRGPDDQGIDSFQANGHHPTVLVHARLSIVDLSPAGHQPMWDHPPDGAAANVTTFNGEIYNYRQLWDELAAAGWPCRTHCDTEVLLHAYRVWGPRAVEHFEGMFAFAVVDAARRQVWLCRDRVGIKPLYIFRPASGGLLFASELRALLAAGPELVPRRVNLGALESFLAQGAVMGEEAIVQGVELLPPGTSLLCDLDGNIRRTTRYWSAAFGAPTGAVLEAADGSASAVSGGAVPASGRRDYVGSLRENLKRALRRTLIADVPVGLFLSSGIDSAAVATVAREVSEHELRTVSVGFDQPEFDESGGAAAIARGLRTHHTSIRLDGHAVLASFDDVLAALDQPTVDGFNTFHVSKAARDAGLTVALSGLGGDELFGGYATFRDLPRLVPLLRLFRHLPLSEKVSNLNTVPSVRSRIGNLPRGRALLKLFDATRRGPNLADIYLLRRELWLGMERGSLLLEPSGATEPTGLPRAALAEIHRYNGQSATLDGIAHLEYSTYMRHMLLRDADVMSMAHALELRVPLLEHYVVECAASARAEWRKPDPRPKPLLIDAAGPRLPERVWRDKKRGFAFPWNHWMLGALRPRAEATLYDAPRWEALGLNAVAVRESWDRFVAGDRSMMGLHLVALLVIDDYCRRHRLSL